MSSVPRPSGSLPSYFWIPEGARFEAADEAADLARALGDQVDEPEIAALRILLAEDARGKRIALESGLFCGRQNVKTWAGQRMVLYRGWVHSLKRIVWTAHLYKTTQDTFNELISLIESHSFLEQQVLKISRGNGEEGIQLRNGCQIDFVARSQKSARGWAADEVVGDEALFLTPLMFGAVFPTLSSRPDPHFTHLSSPGVPSSEVIRGVRDRGRAGGDPSLAYGEWTSSRETCKDPMCSHKPGTAGCQLDDLEKVRAANPAHPRRISLDYIQGERRAMPVGEYMRERMGWWEDPPTSEESSLFPMEQWAERLSPDSTVADDAPIAYMVDTSWDRQTSWISVAGLNAQGIPHVEIVKTGYGQDWVVPWLQPRVDERRPVAIGLQGGNAPVSTLADKLEKQFGDLVHVMTGIDCARACGRFFDAVEKGPLAHIGQEQLEDAMTQAVARPMGEGWVLDRKLSPVDVSNLFATAGALYLLLTTDPPKKKRSRVVGW